MAAQQSSTEMLRPSTPVVTHSPSITTTTPEETAQASTHDNKTTTTTTNNNNNNNNNLAVPGIHVDGATDDDERQPRSTEARSTTATLNAPSANPSRAPSPSLLSQYPHTQVTYDDPDFRRPPPLGYSLRPRKKAIFWFWTLIVVDCIFMPIGLYFGMWYGLTRDELSANAVFSISTALLGTVSIVEYFVRFHRLWKKQSSCRVIGAQRWYLDWFHWNLSAGWFFVMIELIAGTCPHDPPIRVLAMPASTMLFVIGCQLLLMDVLRIMKVPAPCRISSLPVGAPLRPGIYAYIEDICAVDGSGGTQFRQRLNLRYQASKHFREMLHRLTLFWAIGAILCSAATTAIVFTIQRDAAYVVGWVLPFLWAGVWTAITIPWVQRELKVEYEQWTTANFKA
ncbi:hypothetical protein T440DRAFT_464891 [Plenodomus tracheiphilus IPT5]|uniref:Uncharacterized protein n=1 Tax=Plenodomus tracheiphilus IPT5 TaxID=1408161 RepID=A0A6A7BH86_9PLEO|nr:hypothetical protein T440DRAFT_464891 [Plenodomus tracheiphilus IPT5]